MNLRAIVNFYFILQVTTLLKLIKYYAGRLAWLQKDQKQGAIETLILSYINY